MKVVFTIGDSPAMDEEIARLFALVRRRGFYERQGNKVETAAPLLQGSNWPSNPHGIWKDADQDDFWDEISTQVCLGEAAFVWLVGANGAFTLTLADGAWVLEYRGSDQRLNRQCGTGEAVHARLRTWMQADSPLKPTRVIS